MADYTLHTKPIQPFSADDFARCEEMLRQLGPVKDLIQKCEKCNIPVSAAKADCEALTAWFQSVLAEFAGPQGTVQGPLV